jgi:hypothetical protein
MNKRRSKKIAAYLDFYLLPKPFKHFTKAPIIGPRDRNLAIIRGRRVKHAIAFSIQESPLGALFRGVPMLAQVFDEMFLEEES